MLDKISPSIWISSIWLTSSVVVYGSYRFVRNRAKKKIEAKGYRFIKKNKINIKEEISLFALASVPCVRYDLLSRAFNEEDFNKRVLENGLKNKTIVKVKN